MSQVLRTFDAAVRTAVREPLYLLVVVVASIGAGMAGVILGLIPLVGPLINGVVLTPALLVATLGSAHAVRHGESAVDGATDALDRATGAVIGAYAVLMGAYVAALIVLGILFVLVGAGGSVLANGSSALSSASAVLFVVVGFLVFLVAIAVAMAVQFVAPSAVVAGTGAMDSLKTAYRFVRQNLLGVTGFSLVLMAVGIAGALVIAGLYAGGRALDPLAGAVLGVLGYLGLLLVLGVVTPLYQVTYFEETVEDDVLPEGYEWPDEGAAEDGTAGDEVEAGDADAGGFAVEMAGEESDEAGETESSENGTDSER